MPESTADTYAVIEMLGHRVVAGRVQECKRFGVEGTLIDVPAVDGAAGWQTFVAGNSIYAVTPCTAEQAAGYLQRNYARPPDYLRALPAPAPAEQAERQAEIADDTAFLRRLIDELDAVLMDPGAYVECAGRRLELDPEADVYVIKEVLPPDHCLDGTSAANEFFLEIARTPDLEQALIQLQPHEYDYSEPEDPEEDDDAGADF